MTTFNEWTGTYFRLYLNKEREKARVEAVERPGKRLSEAIEEKLAPDLVLIKLAERILDLLQKRKASG